jgi:hypothetical protein
MGIDLVLCKGSSWRAKAAQCPAAAQRKARCSCIAAACPVKLCYVGPCGSFLLALRPCIQPHTPCCAQVIADIVVNHRCASHQVCMGSGLLCSACVSCCWASFQHRLPGPALGRALTASGTSLEGAWRGTLLPSAATTQPLVARASPSKEMTMQQRLTLTTPKCAVCCLQTS